MFGEHMVNKRKKQTITVQNSGGLFELSCMNNYVKLNGRGDCNCLQKIVLPKHTSQVWQTLCKDKDNAKSDNSIHQLNKTEHRLLHF